MLHTYCFYHGCPSVSLFQCIHFTAPQREGTFYEKGLLVIDVHEAVGTGVAVASKGVSDQLLPGGHGDCDVIVLHPAVLTWIIDVSPVVTSISLAFVNQHGMKSVRNLEIE